MLDNFNLNKLRESDTKVSYMDGFSPMMINETYLRELGVGVQPSQETLSELRRGSSAFLNRYEDKSMVTDSSFSLKDISFDEPLKTHRYTNKCPIDVLEVDPMVGCNLNCLYCLVRAGDHSAPKTVYENYGSYLRTKLEENGLNHYYYFSANNIAFFISQNHTVNCFLNCFCFLLNDILDIFEEYNQFLLKEGYCDTDIICEEPTSLDQFLLKEQSFRK